MLGARMTSLEAFGDSGIHDIGKAVTQDRDRAARPKA
jgi:hypothetical protein